MDDTRPVVRPIARAKAAVDIQYARTCLTDEPGYSHDAELFPVVLRRFILQVERVNDRHLDGAADDALERSKIVVPAWKHVRDVLEHIDDYQQGRGKLQRAGLLQVPESHDLYPGIFTSARSAVLSISPDRTERVGDVVGMSYTLQATEKGWARSPLSSDGCEWWFDLEVARDAADELFEAVCDIAEEQPGSAADDFGETD